VEIVTAQAPAREVTALYEAHALSLIRLAYVMLGDRPAAEDVVQEAFLGLYQRWSKLRDTASAPGYLRASVLNGCRMVLRSSARRRYYLDLSEEETARSMGVRRGTVKSATSRALAALGRRMQEYS
jgi:DNA-directed RNA polymerase specialized sigma24 family protein